MADDKKDTAENESLDGDLDLTKSDTDDVVGGLQRPSVEKSRVDKSRIDKSRSERP